MKHMTARLFALLIILIFGGLMYYNWHQLISEGAYSTKLAALTPVGVIGGVFLLLFPSKIGKPETAKDKTIIWLIFIVGLAAGLLNWYLMDPGFFGK